MIIDVHVHTDVSKSLDDFSQIIREAERFDALLVTYSIRPVKRGARHQYPTPEFVHAANEETYALMQRYPDRVRGFVYVNPAHARESREEMELRLGQQGFIGLKLWHAIPCSDPRVDALLDICEHYHVPALQHTFLKVGGLKFGESEPPLVAALAARHPKVTVIAAHSGGDWEYGAKVFRNSPNVLLDIAGGECWADYIEVLVDHCGIERVIFGTDMPGRSFTSQVAKVHGANLSDTDKQKILYHNMANVLASVDSSAKAAGRASGAMPS